VILSPDVLTAAGAVLFVALGLYLALLTGRLGTKRQLDDKDKQINYLQRALEKSEEQKAALMVTAQTWTKTWEAIERIAAGADGEPSEHRRAAR